MDKLMINQRLTVGIACHFIKWNLQIRHEISKGLKYFIYFSLT